MPLVFVLGKSDWLPAAELADSFNFFTKQEFETTRRIIEELPGIVARVMTQVDRKEYKPEEIEVLPGHIHPWAQNAPDLIFDLQPGQGALPNHIKFQQRRRADIRDGFWNELRMFLGEFLNEHNFTEVPSYDIEVRPLNGSGYSVDLMGDIAATWGNPEVDQLDFVKGPPDA